MSEMDKILRNKLFDHGSQMPDGMWDRIESGLKEKQKRRGFIWFWVGGIVLIGALGLWTLSTVQQDAELVNEFKQDVKGSSDKEIPKVEFNVEYDNNSPVTSKSAKSDFSQKKTSSRQNISTSDRKAERAPIAENATTDIVQVQSYPANDQLQKIDENIAKENAALSSKDKESTEKEIITIPSLYTFSLANIDLKERQFPDPIGCPPFSNSVRTNLFAELYYKPLYVTDVIGSNSPEVGDSYLALRRDSESPLYSWAAGGYLGWISNYNVGLKAGLEYEVINSRFTYEDPEAIRNQTIITIDTIFNTDGSFTTSSDTSIVQVSGTEIQRIHNYHKTLSIPIHALYHLSFKSFALEFSGGPIFNISYMNRGKIVDPANRDQWYTKGESGSYDIYKNRLSVSFSLSVSAMYSLTEKIQLFARPEFKFHPTSISKVSSPFTQRSMNTGLSMGARYYFSGNPNF